MSDVLKQPPSANRLPWSLVAAVLVGMALLRFTSEQTMILLVLGTALVAQRISGYTLPAQLAGGRALRVGVYALIAMLVGLPDEGIQQWYLKPDYTNLVGHLLAAEIVIRAWSPGPLRPNIVLMLSALLLAMGSNTVDRTYVQLFAPVYFVLMIAALRSQFPAGRREMRFMVMRMAVGLMAVVLGFVMIDVLTRVERELQIWAMNFVRRSARSSDIGLSMAPRLGPTFNPEPSMSRVLIIDGPRSERHWRALSFDTFEANQWGPSLRVRDFRLLTENELGLVETDVMLDVTILGDTFDVLPLPLNVSGVDAVAEVDRESGGTVRFHDARVGQDFGVSVPKDERHQGLASLPPDEAHRARMLEVPPALDPAVGELAKQVAGEGQPMIRLIRLSQYLRSSHEYSLNFEPETTDPLSDFILNRRAAHCQYFASAMVVMSRAVGIPARMVTGFYAHEASGDDRMIVRDRDAHAWAECWVDGTGWITMDATPSAGLPDSLFGPPSRLRRIWESVVDFPAMIQKWLSVLSREMILWAVLIIAVVVIILGVVQVLRREKPRGERAYALPDARLVEMGQRFEKWLARGGTVLAKNQTWKEATRLNRSSGTEFIDAYDEARFGGANGQTIDRLDEILRALESQ